MIRMGVSGLVFLLVPAYPGCPGPTAVKRLCVCVCVCVCCIRANQEMEVWKLKTSAVFCMYGFYMLICL